MTMFTEDGSNCFHCVGWSSIDDVSEAHFHYFDNHWECIEFAEKFSNADGTYVWIAEKGKYLNQGSSHTDDWMYHWWNKAAQNGDAGALPQQTDYMPQQKIGVPEEKSWDYHVAYKPLDSARA